MRKTKLAALTLVLVLMLQVVLPSAFAAKAITQNAQDEKGVVISLEGLTLGQGFYIEPTFISYDEIDSIIDCYEGAITAAEATLALFEKLGIECRYTSYSPDLSDLYLTEIKDIDKGYTNVPQIILDNGGNVEYENDDEWLGEFDYNMMSGWMITLDHVFIKQSAGSEILDQTENHVIRWQFTLYGYGADLGSTEDWGMGTYYVPGDRTELYKAYAQYNSRYNDRLADYLEQMEILDLDQAAVDAILESMNEEFGALDETDESADVTHELETTLAYLYSTVPEPQMGTTAGEWTVIALARGEYLPTSDKYFADYYDRIVESVIANGSPKLHNTKSTENSRVIMALSSIGKSSRNVGGYDLVEVLSDINYLKKQGLNGPVFALIALDTVGYETTNSEIRNECISFILGKEISGGGWALSGSTPDPDMTAMTMQALTPYKDTNAEVRAALERGIETLSSIQRTDGGYASWGTVNSESIAQVIVALTGLGINPSTDGRFVKNGKSAVDALLNFYVEGGGFKHTETGSVNAMATDQACYALVAYQRFLDGKTRLYDMSDVNIPSYDENGFMNIKAYLSVPAIVSNKAGSTFNMSASLDGWDTDKDYKLLDCIVKVPEGLKVESVTAGAGLTGGSVYYALEEATGKLRIVYAGLDNYSNIVLNAGEFPAEIFNVSFGMDNAIDAESLDFAILGMSLKLGADSTDSQMMHIIDTSESNASAVLERNAAVFAYELYTGDGIDLISSDKMAVAVLVTEVDSNTCITYKDGTSLNYSKQLSDKTGVTTYVAIVNAATSLDEMNIVSNYTITVGTPNSIIFGDANSDGVINAQDALDTVSAWLRKTEEPNNTQILQMNVNGDSRINTFDALGIVDYFVNGTEFIVITNG
ncbi:MAG: hypothetical protein J1E60_07810 [Christensenellaceae bacterium]|nr:hypothetical protein [Christensenellaceae bacterium]